MFIYKKILRCAYFIGCAVILKEIKWKIRIFAKVHVAPLKRRCEKTAYNGLVMCLTNAPVSLKSKKKDRRKRG